MDHYLDLNFQQNLPITFGAVSHFLKNPFFQEILTFQEMVNLVEIKPAKMFRLFVPSIKIIKPEVIYVKETRKQLIL